MHNYKYIKAPMNISLLFFGLSGISAVFPVIRVFPVNLGTACMQRSVYSPDRALSPDLTGSDRIGPEIGYLAHF